MNSSELIKGKRIKQGIYGCVFLLLVAIEVLIAVFIHDAFIRPYVGDMLIVVVVYCFVRIWLPEKCRLLPLYVFLFASAVEGLQALKLVQRLGLEENRFLRILIGSVFDLKDIGCYAVGCLILVFYEYFRYVRKF